MKYKIEITEKAKSDLHGVYEYIAFQLLSPVSAEKLLDKLESAILSLETMPFRFKQYESEPWKARGLRTMTVDHFIVFYIPDKCSETVMILRVMYGGRNLEKQLKIE